MRPSRRKFRHRRRFQHRANEANQHCPKCKLRPCTLADVPSGCRARVTGFTEALIKGRGTYLQAYGLMPGHWVRVLQHSPVMVVEIDHTELAMEREMAMEVNVDEVAEV